VKVRNKKCHSIVYEVLDEGQLYYVVKCGDTHESVLKSAFEPAPEEKWEDVTGWFEPTDLAFARHIAPGYRLRKIHWQNRLDDPGYGFIVEVKR